jgi:hypothetical protein
VLQKLRMKDVNNVHLVCRNLHQIANLHVNPKLRFDWTTSKSLKRLAKLSRIFEELEFIVGSDGYFKSPEKFQMIEKYLGFAGPYIKKLTSGYLEVDPQILQKLLNLLPNLEVLEPQFSWNSTKRKPIKLSLKSRKIKRLSIDYSRMIEVSEKSAIRELKLNYWTSKAESCPDYVPYLRELLRRQEKNLKKVSIFCNYAGILADLKELRLEELEFLDNCECYDIPLDLLKQQADLRSLKLSKFKISNELYKTILGMKNLECLDLGPANHGFILEPKRRSLRRTEKALGKLHKMKSLKTLKLYHDHTGTISKFGVFENLEELHADFQYTSESVREMKRITPNLKRIVIGYAFTSSPNGSDKINALLEVLEHLESVTIRWKTKWDLGEKVYLKTKKVDIYCRYDRKFIVEQLLKRFPNLETLYVNDRLVDLLDPNVDEPVKSIQTGGSGSVFRPLAELNQLKLESSKLCF